MSESDQEPVVSPQLVGGRLRWQPVTGDAIVAAGRFDWIALVRLAILAAAAAVAFMALEWQTGVYENAAHNSELILARQESVRSDPAPAFGPLPTVAPRELAPPVPDPADPLAVEADRQQSAFQHVVQPGETLAEIATRYSVNLEDLLQANPGIVDPDLIVPGDSITITT
jgi:hypothetical protein